MINFISEILRDSHRFFVLYKPRLYSSDKKFFFYSGMDASHPEILFLYTAIVPAAPQGTVRDAGIVPGTAGLQSMQLCLLH
jgi:hypothetical protein